MKRKIIGIYLITSPSRRHYVGQSKDIDKRWISYKNMTCKTQPVLFRSFEKHGVERHTFTVLEECSGALLNERERYWQDYYQVLDGGLNCLLTSTLDKPKVYSLEVCNKISESNKGKEITIEHREKLRIAFLGEKNHFYGKTHTEETRAKISKAHKGRKITGEALENIRKSKKKGKDNPLFGIPRTEELKQKIREKHLGKVLTESHKENISKGLLKVAHRLGRDMSGENNTMYGKKHKESTKKLISMKNKGNKQSKENIYKMSIRNTGGGNPRAKIVLDTITGIYYDCGKDAAHAIGRNYRTIKCYLNGSLKNKTSLIYV
jgi:group I intron endonuclease